MLLNALISISIYYVLVLDNENKSNIHIAYYHVGKKV